VEAWAIIVVLVLSNLFTFGSTYFVTRLQLRHSDTQLEKEHGRALEVDRKERRREVRGETLIKMRSVLSVLAEKQLRVIILAAGLRPSGSIAYDQRYIEGLQAAVDDLSVYVKSGDLLQAMSMLDDREVVNAAKDIISDWGRSQFAAPPFQIVDPKKMQEAEELIKSTEAKILQVQALINKKLEEL